MNAFDRNGKVALVTGSARRIGRALALALAEDGYDLYLHYLASEADVRSLSWQVEAAGRRAVPVRADLSDAAEAGNLIGRCRELGPVSCLINNAALYGQDDAATLDAGTLDRHHAVNVRAPVLLAQAFAAQLPEGREGLAVNLLDFRVAALTPRSFSYGVSKAALQAAGEMLAIALAPAIRVNAIAPGLVLPSPAEQGERYEHLRAGTLLRRGVDPADIVGALRYLLSARAVTGQTIHVDAGQRLISKRKAE